MSFYCLVSLKREMDFIYSKFLMTLTHAYKPRQFMDSLLSTFSFCFVFDFGLGLWEFEGAISLIAVIVKSHNLTLFSNC